MLLVLHFKTISMPIAHLLPKLHIRRFTNDPTCQLSDVRITAPPPPPPPSTRGDPTTGSGLTPCLAHPPFGFMLFLLTPRSHHTVIVSSPTPGAHPSGLAVYQGDELRPLLPLLLAAVILEESSCRGEAAAMCGAVWLLRVMHGLGCWAAAAGALPSLLQPFQFQAGAMLPRGCWTHIWAAVLLRPFAFQMSHTCVGWHVWQRNDDPVLYFKAMPLATVVSMAMQQHLSLTRCTNSWLAF